MRSPFAALFLSLILSSNALNEDFVAKLQTTSEKTDQILTSIFKEWEVDKYPNFLKSCFMHKSSWEIMKYKLMDKIISAQLTGASKPLKISFMGSSVTAGHDSFFNASTPVVTGVIMDNAFKDLNVPLEAKNMALGNNPCVPYDVCVKFFSGYDADIVHWEQNYFCDGNPIMETFIRQAMTIPSKPVVVFSEANTGHWPPEKCKDQPHSHKLTASEEDLLKASIMDVVTDKNKDEYHRAWGFVSSIDKKYHGAGIQTFTHLKHEDYACLGPYIKDWMVGAASWHPSVIGHRLRASHHAYFWLTIWKEAVEEVRATASHRQLDAIHLDVLHKLGELYPPMHDPVHRTEFVDNSTCYTDYEPKAVQEASLKNLVVSGLSEDPKTKPGWEFLVYEDIVDKGLVQRSVKMGYLDRKYLMHGNQKSGPLSLKLKMDRAGPVFICETPGIWGKLPNGFDHLYSNDGPEVFLTLNTGDQPANFQFSKEGAKQLVIWHSKEIDICVELRMTDKDKEVPAGNHVLTIAPKSDISTIFAWLLTP